MDLGKWSWKAVDLSTCQRCDKYSWGLGMGALWAPKWVQSRILARAVKKCEEVWENSVFWFIFIADIFDYVFIYSYYRLEVFDFILNYSVAVALSSFVLLIFWEINGVVYVKAYWQSEWDNVLFAVHFTCDYFDLK